MAGTDDRPLGGWVKARDDLPNSPQVFGMARRLAGSHDFWAWLAPGLKVNPSQPPITQEALRLVVTQLCIRVWSWARGVGKYRGDDMAIRFICIDEIDAVAGPPGFGEAMRLVGWAAEGPPGERGVVLPNFRQHNVPRTNAEKQKAYRERKKSAAGGGPPQSPGGPAGALPGVTERDHERYPTVQTVTPLTPLGGGGGEGSAPATLAPAATAVPGRLVLPCDRPDLRAAVERVKAHYDRAVSPTQRTSGRDEIRTLLAAGVAEADLTRAADGYAAECRRNSHDKRSGAARFYADGGLYLDHLNAPPPAPYAPPRPPPPTGKRPSADAVEAMRIRAAKAAAPDPQGQGGSDEQGR